MAKGPPSFTSELRRAESALRRSVRCRWPVMVTLRRGLVQSGLAGCADVALSPRGRRYVAMIDIDESLTGREAIDTLVHEYAHIVAWGADKNDHGPNWGKAYARCYRVVIEREGRKR